MLVGGSPLRLLRLSPDGARYIGRWREGHPVGSFAAERALARRLVACGLCHPLPEPVACDRLQLEVVVPARDRVAGLRRCLAGLAGSHAVVVVDDGSRDRAAVAEVCSLYGARVIWHDRPLGPAAARNAGLRASRAALVAFVDSDCLPQPGWLDLCAAHLTDPLVAAAGPRVTGPASSSVVGRLEAVRSPLDLGLKPGPVGPSHSIRYLPSTAFVARRLALGDGFDETLSVGEDVDMAWRLADAGWMVRYEPRARVLHPHRRKLGGWLSQRASYGASAQALAKRHPGRLSHLSVSPQLTAPWILAAAGYRRTAALLAAAATARLAAGLDGRNRPRFKLAARSVQAQLGTPGQLERAVRRAYLPVVVTAALRYRRMASAVVVCVLACGLADWARRRPRLGPATYVALCLLDDAAYTAGLWYGCLRHRTLGPLVPQLRLARPSKLPRHARHPA